MDAMMKLLLAGCGGFVGASGRCAVALIVTQLKIDKVLGVPVATLVVNVAGCFAIGVLGALAARHESFSPELRTFLIVGVLGGFTTYSAFGYENFALIRDGLIAPFLANVAIHLSLGLSFVALGYYVASAR